MATYGELYFKVLERTSNQYLGLHNLNVLDQLDRKANCFTQFGKQPSEYYNCFRNIERQTDAEATVLGTDYVVVEDEYKLCGEGCKQMIGEEANLCANRCGEAFSNSIQQLYSKFYKQKLGKRKEYKKVLK